MTRRKGNLSVALNKSAGNVANDAPVVSEVQSEAPPKNPHARPSRTGKKNISAYFDEAVARQLKHIAVDEDKSIQDMLGEALNLLFEKYGKKPIA